MCPATAVVNFKVILSTAVRERAILFPFAHGNLRNVIELVRREDVWRKFTREFPGYTMATPSRAMARLIYGPKPAQLLNKQLRENVGGSKRGSWLGRSAAR